MEIDLSGTVVTAAVTESITNNGKILFHFDSFTLRLISKLDSFNICLNIL